MKKIPYTLMIDEAIEEKLNEVKQETGTSKNELIRRAIIKTYPDILDKRHRIAKQQIKESMR